MAIQLFVPTFEVEECLEEIRQCLEKGWTGIGYKTVEFEDAWKRYTGHSCAHFLNSGTVGLNLAFELLKRECGWADGDEVITTPLTFVSTNHAILLNNLSTVFADVDDSLCLDPASIEQRITPRTRAVLYVGMGGNIGQYEQVAELCRTHNLKLVLDAAHMAGTRLRGQAPGLQADVAIYSFQAVKPLPTADSGMICFKDPALDALARKMTWLGINKDTYSRVANEKASYKWRYDVEYVGYKYHGNSVIAAIGLVQLRYLDRDNAYRRQLAAWYDSGFAGQPNIGRIEMTSECESSRHLYQILVPDRDSLLEHLNSVDIYPGVHYIDNAQYRMYADGQGVCPKASYASEHLLSLPMHLRLRFEDINEIVTHVTKFVGR